MMVYSVCRKLVELGTTEIHLMGHSRGGTIVMECAKECNAKYFRDACKVKSYTPISAMSLYTGIMTSFEPVTLFMAGAILFVLMTL
jgi:pimeloyl-ACP methyl ester carboxylesterase